MDSELVNHAQSHPLECALSKLTGHTPLTIPATSKPKVVILPRDDIHTGLITVISLSTILN